MLVVDLDGQGSASLALGVDRDALTPCTATALYRLDRYGSVYGTVREKRSTRG